MAQKSKKKLRFQRSYFAFPYLILSAIFVILPLIIILINAFMGADGKFTFSNFGMFFSASNMKILGRSLLIALLTTVFSLIIAFPLALILANSKINKTGALVMLFVLPMLINSILRTYAISNIFDLLHITNSYVKVVMATVFDFFPFMLLPMYTTLVSIDSSLSEASSDLGGNALTTFIKVRLPLAVPGIISGIIMVFMPAISSFAIKDIVARTDTNMSLIGNVIDYYFSGRASLYGIGAAYSFILLLIVAGGMLVANKASGGKADLSGPLGGQLS